MSEETLDNNDDAIKSIEAAHNSLVAVVSMCEESRQFLGVIRLSITNNNIELAMTLINSMIIRLDPLLQNFYKDMPDGDLIDIVSDRLASPKIWSEEAIEHVELSNNDINQINKKNKR